MLVSKVRDGGDGGRMERHNVGGGGLVEIEDALVQCN